MYKTRVLCSFVCGVHCAFICVVCSHVVFDVPEAAKRPQRQMPALPCSSAHLCGADGLSLSFADATRYIVLPHTSELYTDFVAMIKSTDVQGYHRSSRVAVEMLDLTEVTMTPLG
jgi:hypothetical protein